MSGGAFSPGRLIGIVPFERALRILLQRGWSVCVSSATPGPLFNAFDRKGEASLCDLIRVVLAPVVAAPAERSPIQQGRIPIRMRPCCTCRPCKPGSVPGASPGPLSFIYDGSHLPPPATYPPASGEQPLIAGIHGLATHGTYGRTTSLPPRWALTPPFHPYRSEIPDRGHPSLRDGALPGRLYRRLFSVTLP